MFASIRKHQSWLLTVIIVVTILSFVALYTNSTGFNSLKGGGSSFGTIDGRAIDESEYRAAQREAMISYHLRARGEWPRSDAESEDYVKKVTLRQIFIAHKMSELNIHIDDKATAEMVANYVRNPTTKAVDLDRYHAFIKQDLGSQNLVEEDFLRYIRHELGTRYLESIFGLGGELVSPRLIESTYRHENERVASEAVFFAASNYVDKVVVSTNELQEFFSQKQAHYIIPAQVQVSYVTFEAAAYLGEASKLLLQDTNLNQTVELAYLKSDTNSFVDAKGKALTESQAKDQIKDEIRHDRALRLAHKSANEFAQALFEMEPQMTTNLYKLASAKGLKVLETEPFSKLEGPKDPLLPESLGEVAFKLSETQPFVNPLVSSNGVYVIAFKRKIDSQAQPLAKVRGKVIEDFREAKSLELARADGRGFHDRAVKEIARGKSFTDVCAMTKAKYEEIPAFARSDSPKIPSAFEPFLYSRTAMATSAGKLSEFVESSSGGFVVYVKQKLPVDEQKLKKDLPRYEEQFREFYQNRAFQDWLNKQIQASMQVAQAAPARR